LARRVKGREREEWLTRTAPLVDPAPTNTPPQTSKLSRIFGSGCGGNSVTNDEAAYLVNGIDPDESDYSKQQGHRFRVPPARAAAGARGVGRILAGPERRGRPGGSEAVHRFGRRTPDPDAARVAEAAADNGHEVPWLEFARSRPALRRYLPEAEWDRAETIEVDRAETIEGCGRPSPASRRRSSGYAPRAMAAPIERKSESIRHEDDRRHGGSRMAP
jgi:hypothetical protein